MNRFRKCATSTGHVGTVRLELCRGRDGRRVYSFKNEEYMADFCLVSRRALDDFEYKIFRYHYLLGAGWRLCCGRLHMERGDFFHALYRIEQKLGRTFVELQPYPLYPLNEYFNGVVRKHDCVPAATVFPSTKRFPLPVSA